MSTTQRIRVEVGEATKRFRAVTVVLVVAFVAVAGVLFALNRIQARESQREVAALQARTDSILQASASAVQALQGRMAGLASALESSRQEVTRLQRELTEAQQSGSHSDVAAVREQLASATQALQYRQAAAQVDYRSIVSANQRAVAMVWVSFGGGEVFTGTAFAVRSDGTLITNRHVVAGPDGTRRPDSIAVRFADSRQTWRGRLLWMSQEADLAAIKVDIRGGVPTVQGINSRPDTLRQGDPVAMIGFPLGTDLPMLEGFASTTFTAGSVSKVLSNLIQIDGYGAEGASGSPVFDRNGLVVSVLYGGQAGTGGRIVFSIPSTYVARLLDVLR